MRAPSFAIVDDDLEFCAVAGELARDYGFRCTGIHSVSQAKAWLDRHVPDLMLVDVRLPDGSGYDVISGLKRRHKGQIIMVSGQASVAETARAVRLDVDDFWIKPVHADMLEQLLRRIADDQRNRSSSEPGPFGMVGSSRAMSRLRQEMTRIASVNGNVMIFGESGSGKRMVAQGLHDASRTEGELVSYDCALTRGHQDAFAGLQGLFESQGGGALLLRNVDLLDADAQRMLAGFLDQYGSPTSKSRPKRIISLTSEEVNLTAQRMHAGLFYRLCEHGIQVPPLRERGHDVLDLAEFFVAQHNLASGQHKMLIRDSVVTAHSWPGNVRELATAVTCAYSSAIESVRIKPLVLIPGSGLKPTDRGRVQAGAGVNRSGTAAGELRIKVGSSMRTIELEVLKATIASCGGEKKAAAKVLGITSRTVHNWLRREREDAGDDRH